MIEYTSGDILKCETEAIINTINCVGVVERTYAWNSRKRRFTRRQITIAVDRLSKQGWVTPLESQISA